MSKLTGSGDVEHEIENWSDAEKIKWLQKELKTAKNATGEELKFLRRELSRQHLIIDRLVDKHYHQEKENERILIRIFEDISNILAFLKINKGAE